MQRLWHDTLDHASVGKAGMRCLPAGRKMRIGTKHGVIGTANDRITRQHLFLNSRQCRPKHGQNYQIGIGVRASDAMFNAPLCRRTAWNAHSNGSVVITPA